MVVSYRLLALVVGILLSQCIKANEPLIWGYAEFAPYIYMLPNGKPAGPFADLANATLNHADIKYQALYTPNRRARKAINSGLSDFAIGPLAVLDNPEIFQISKQAVAKIDIRAYWIGDKKPIIQPTDMNGNSVILISSFQYSGLRKYIENPRHNIELTVNVEDHRRALSALSLNRANYMLGYHAPVELMQLEMNLDNLNSHSLKQADIYFIIRKSVKNSRDMMNKIEASYAVLYPQQH